MPLGLQRLTCRESGPAPKPFVDLTDEPVHWDLGDSLSYSQYLNLDKLLDAQQPLSYQHDEMLFIVIHQVSELWMKFCLHELNAVVDCVRRDDLGPTFKMLARVSTIQQQLLQSWDVLATITPSDYSAFRNSLGTSSGFQSAQYRMLEFLIGNKNSRMIEVFRSEPPVYDSLERVLKAPSLYDEVAAPAEPARARPARCGHRPGFLASPMRPASRSPPHGSASITIPSRNGTCTSWPSAWSTWTTSSSSGASRT